VRHRSDIRQRISPSNQGRGIGLHQKRGEQLLDDVTPRPPQSNAGGGHRRQCRYRCCGWRAPFLAGADGWRRPVFCRSKTGRQPRKKPWTWLRLSDEVQRVPRRRDQVGESAAEAKAFASDNLDRFARHGFGGTDRSDKPPIRSMQRPIGGTTLASSTDSLKDKRPIWRSRGSGQRSQGQDDPGRRFGGLQLQDIASDATSSARRAAGTAADAGLNAVKTVAILHRSHWSRRQSSRNHRTKSVLVAGSGLLVGASSQCCPLDIEDGLIGETSNSVKKRAQAAASQGIDAQRCRRRRLRQAVRQAEAEGLSPMR